MALQERDLPVVSNQGRGIVNRLNPLIAPPPEFLQPLDFLMLRVIPSHRGLIDDLGAIDKDREPRTRLDAIIVPTFRTPTHLDKAARVARLAQPLHNEPPIPLIYLCSGDASVGGVWDHLSEPKRKVDTRNITPIQLPEGYKLPGLHLDTDRIPIPGYSRERDIATKRNIGLALARIAGWNTVLFLDDDIGGIEQSHLNHMLRGFDHPERQVVGWSYGSTFEGDPLASDNSQVHHVYRMLDGEVETFIGGGSTAVRITNDTALFPNIYGEDWLFYSGMMRRGRSALARAGDLAQSPKDVFGYGQEKISVDEEFGDTLAEGLFRAQHFDRSLTDPKFQSESYWWFIDHARKGFITKLQEGLPTGEPYDHMNNVLAASFARHDNTWPKKLTEYTKAWLNDLDKWSEWYNGLPSLGSVDDALSYLTAPTAFWKRIQKII